MQKLSNNHKKQHINTINDTSFTLLLENIFVNKKFINSHEDREESFHENFHPKTLFCCCCDSLCCLLPHRKKVTKHKSDASFPR